MAASARGLSTSARLTRRPPSRAVRFRFEWCVIPAARADPAARGRAVQDVRDGEVGQRGEHLGHLRAKIGDAVTTSRLGPSATTSPSASTTVRTLTSAASSTSWVASTIAVPLLGEFAQRGDQPRLGRIVEPAGRLVEQQQRGRESARRRAQGPAAAPRTVARMNDTSSAPARRCSNALAVPRSTPASASALVHSCATVSA